MVNTNRLIFSLFRATDLFSLAFSLICLASYQNYFVEGRLDFDFFTVRFSLYNCVWLVMFATIYLIIFEHLALYQPKFLSHSFKSDALMISKAIFLISIIALAFGGLMQISIFSSWATLTVFLPVCIYSTLLLRHLVWTLLTKLHLGDQNCRAVLILGNGAQAQHYAKLIKSLSPHGYQFLGFLVSKNETEIKAETDEILGCFDQIDTVSQQNVIDEIIVCVDTNLNDPDVSRIIFIANARGILLRFPLAPIVQTLFKNTEMTRLSYNNTLISEKGDLAPELSIQSGYQMGGGFLVKRIMDLLISVCLIVCLSPLLLLCILAIRLDSKGEAIFVQERVGYNGRLFRLFKFRTMIEDAESYQAHYRENHNELDGAMFKMKSDPRVTRVGRFLRKSSIDELPQLLNVLMGDMSLVGPRPLPKGDYEQFTEVEHLRRLSVLPGITGIWQVTGRNNLSYSEWIKLDFAYIDNWSHWLDLKILLKTIPAVIKGRGAF